MEGGNPKQERTNPRISSFQAPRVQLHRRNMLTRKQAQLQAKQAEFNYENPPFEEEDSVNHIVGVISVRF